MELEKYLEHAKLNSHGASIVKVIEQVERSKRSLLAAIASLEVDAPASVGGVRGRGVSVWPVPTVRAFAVALCDALEMAAYGVGTDYGAPYFTAAKMAVDTVLEGVTLMGVDLVPFVDAEIAARMAVN